MTLSADTFSFGTRDVAAVLALGTTQTLAWASSYYLPAIIVDPLSAELGISTTSMFAAFSLALVLSALIGPRVGRTIDRFGGRGTLAMSNIVFASGLALLGLAPSAAAAWLAWSILGIGMGLGLYDAAFAALWRIYGIAARRPITGITLLAGFASTIGWPLTAWGVAEIGWRSTCLVWAAAHLAIGLPLNLTLPRTTSATGSMATPDEGLPVVIDCTMTLLAAAFAAAWVVTAAMGAHLPRILLAGGATLVEAITAAAMMGPAQVIARIGEVSLLSRYHPLLSARLSTVTHPIGAAIFLSAGGGIAGFALTILHGMGNGVLTIARGTVPLAIFGPEGYGHRLGLLGALSRLAQAFAPLLFGLMLDHFGAGVLWITSALSLSALALLLAVRHTKPV